MTKRLRPVTAVTAALVLLVACTAKTGGGNQAGGPVRPVSLHGAEARYGAAVVPSSHIKFQPGVVVVGGGAKSVRSVTNDGLVWTIDGHAKHADEIAPGKVIAITSFGAGRVLAVEDDGPNKKVGIGPIAITDLISDGKIETVEPIGLKNFQTYTVDRPGLETPLEGGGGSDSGASGSGGAGESPTTEPSATMPGTPSVIPAAFGGLDVPSAPVPTLPPPAKNIPNSEVGDWHIQSICCTAVGIHVGYSKDGARVQGTAELKFTAPSLDFGLDIGGSKVISARVLLNGAASLRFGIAAAVENSAANFKGGRIELPVNIDIPILVGTIPMNIGIQQIFAVSLGLGGKAELDTHGEYALSGGLGFRLNGLTPSVERPTLRTVKSALDNIGSVAVAPSALTFSYALKVSIGLGTPGLNAGLWYQVSSSLGFATSGSQIDPLQGTSLVSCKTVSLSVLGRFGVGYTIPKFVADAINLVLRAVFRKPPLPVLPTGGPAWGPSTLFAKSTPPCSKGSGGGG